MDASINLGRVAQAYVAIRDARAAKKRAWEKADASLEEDQGKLRALMLQLLNATGANSVATDYGTIYRSERLKPSASDWSAVYAWVMEDPERLEIFEKRLKAQFVKEYMDATDGKLPPGVSAHREFEVNVRRPNATKEE